MFSRHLWALVAVKPFSCIKVGTKFVLLTLCLPIQAAAFGLSII